MLLKNTDNEEKDYLKDWPAHYYEIPTARGKMELLHKAEEQGIAVPADRYRRELCEKRFFTRKEDGSADAFMYAWMMIGAAGAAGLPFLGRKRVKKELAACMDLLCLSEYREADELKKEILSEEWRDFGEDLIGSCAGSKNYNAVLMGLMRISDRQAARKLAEEICLVTRNYPIQLGMEEEFKPFRQVMCDTYCRMVADGEEHLRAVFGI